MKLDQNLLSVGQWIDKGLKVTFKAKHCHVYEVYEKEIPRSKKEEFLFQPYRGR